MDTQIEHFDVVIAGGGTVGLALALALSIETAGDLKIAVVAKSFPQPVADGGVLSDRRSSALARASLFLLERLGVWRALAAHAQPVAAIELTDSALDDAVRPTTLSYDLVGGEMPAMVILENARLGGAIFGAVQQARGVKLMPRLAAESYVAEPGGICLRLGDGRRIAGRLLVAADGAHSKLRRLAGIGTVGWPYDQTGIVSIVTPELPHNGLAVQHFLPAGPFALLPMTDNRVCVTWSEQSAEAKKILAMDAVGFRVELERRFGHRLGHLRTVEPPESWPLEMAVARRLIAPRFALVGDAAHTLHPIAGQGLNLGLRDVASLAECITDAARLGLDPGRPDVLDGYERCRRFDNLASASTFDLLNRLFSNDNTLFRSARGAAMGVVNRVPMMKSWFIDEATGANGRVPRMMQPSIESVVAGT